MQSINRKAIDEFQRLKLLDPCDSIISKTDTMSIRAVTFQDGANQDLVETFSRWRANAADGFPNRFTVTVKGTGIWLNRQVLEVKDRILFLIQDSAGRPYGHLGLMHLLESPGRAVIDGVIRGEISGDRSGIMKKSMRTVIEWAFRSLGLHALDIHVLNDNIRALRLYTVLGFVPATLIPLQEKQGNGRVDWVEIDAAGKADRFLLKLELLNSSPLPDETGAGKQ